MSSLPAVAPSHQPRKPVCRTFRVKQLRKPVCRTFRVKQLPAAREPGELLVTIDGQTDLYRFDVLHTAPECGTCAVSMHKFGGETAHHVLVAADGSCSCDCFGSLRWGHCKHAELVPHLLTRLAAAGLFS